jgi:hypothetical protein
VADDIDAYLEEFCSLRDFRAEDLTQLPLHEEAITFLLANGLPTDAAPYLSLAHARTIFRPLSDVWNTPDSGGVLANFLCLYSDGAGNPICVDRRDSTVVWLDHDDHFASSSYVNSGLVTFSEFLLAAQRRTSQLPVDPALEVLDPRAFRDEAFWVRQYGPGGVLSRST